MKLYFDDEDQAQSALEAIDFALEHTKEHIMMYPDSRFAKRELKQLQRIKYKLEAMLPDEE